MKLFGILALTAAAAAGQAGAECKARKFGDLPVTMAGARPLVPAKIDGSDVQFVVDSGASFSLLSPGAASTYKLGIRMAGPGEFIAGIGGTTRTELTTVQTFTLGSYNLPKLDFVVTAGASDSGSVGVIGQNLLGLGDVEYDFAHGALRLFRVEGCDGLSLAYWAAQGQANVIEQAFSDRPTSRLTIGFAYLNGQRIRVVFDTGAAHSALTLRAAGRAGIAPGTPGVVDAGVSYGIGARSHRTWIAPVSSFKIGDEEIKNTRLPFSDFDLDGVDMLLGADFFLSHHIYVANSQHKIYFTYNGGSVFDLTVQSTVAGSSVAAAPAMTTQGGAPPVTSLPAIEGAEPIDAEGYGRRGAAYAARRDYDRALADLTRACDLAPNDARYFFQRARLRVDTHQPVLAMSDLDQTLKLAPDNGRALVMRAALRLAAGDRNAAVADLDAASRLVAKEDDVRSELAELYQAADQLEPALREYDFWLASHEEDGRIGGVLAGRCRTRALLGRDLDKALADCNRVIRGAQTPGILFDSRGLIYLRMGQYDRAIADYDQAIAKNPRLAWSLYGRGLAKLKKGMKAEGDADIAAALAIQPKMAEIVRKYGVTSES